MRKEKFFENILNSIIEGVIIVDEEARITFMNRQASIILRLPIEEALGRHVTEVIPNTRLHIVVSTGRAEIDRTQDINGTVIVTSRIPLRDERGRVIGAVAVFRDVTSVMKMAEEVTNLREMDAMLSAIIDSTYDAISVADAQGRVVLVNKAYTRITGLSPKDVIGKPATVDIAEGESIHMKVAKIRKPIYGARLKVGPMKREVIVNVTPLFVGKEFRGSVAVIHDVSEIIRLTKELEEAKKLIRHMSAKFTFDDVVAKSSIMREVVEKARKISETNASVLLIGEVGTGKKLLAQAIHNASRRRSGPFVIVNCADENVEIELFGYEKRPGILEEAFGGTVFLDEIGKLSMSAQNRLSSFLETGEFLKGDSRDVGRSDARIIASTTIDLEKLAGVEKFSKELYYKLIPIRIPPLRERMEDIPALAEHIVRKLNQEYGRNVEGIDREALSILMDHDWPGNVRELENVIGRAMINMEPDEKILKKEHIPPLAGVVSPLRKVFKRSSLRELVEDFERKIIVETLKRNGWNKVRTAKELGLSVRALYYKMEKLGIGRGEVDLQGDNSGSLEEGGGSSD